MNDTEAAWLAGFLDGEGSFMVTRSHFKWCAAPTYEAVISASNTNLILTQRCKSLAGGRIVTTKPKNIRHKTAHIWQLRGPTVEPVIRRVMPFLISKKEQAELLLKLRSLTKNGSPIGRFGTRKTPKEIAERANIYDQVKALNKRGNPDYADIATNRIKNDGGMFTNIDRRENDRPADNITESGDAELQENADLGTENRAEGSADESASRNPHS